MFGSNKAIMITSLACIGTGLVVGFAGFAASGFDKDVFYSNEKFESADFDLTEEYTSIKVDVVSENVVFKVSEDDQTHVHGWSSKNLEQSVKVDDGTLVITQKDTRKWYEWVTLHFSFDSSKTLTVELPYDEFVELNIDAVSGDIEIPDFITVGELDVDTTSGDVTSSATVTGNASIDVVSGDVNLSNADCDEIEIDTVSGDVIVRDSTCNDISLDTVSGDVELINCNVADEAETDTVSGDVDFVNTNAGSYNTDSVSGDVTHTN